MAPIMVMIIGVVIFLGGSLWYYLSAMPAEPVPTAGTPDDSVGIAGANSTGLIVERPNIRGYHTGIDAASSHGARIIDPTITHDGSAPPATQTPALPPTPSTVRPEARKDGEKPAITISHAYIAGFHTAISAAGSSGATISDVEISKDLEPEKYAYSPTKAFSDLADEDLLKLVTSSASSMREFEQKYKARRRDVNERLGTADALKLSEDQRKQLWAETTREVLASSDDERKTYQSQIWPQARELEAELADRLGERMPKPPHDEIIALKYGALAGASPIEDAAAYLERAAALLK